MKELELALVMLQRAYVPSAYCSGTEAARKVDTVVPTFSLSERNPPLIMQDSFDNVNETGLRGMSLVSVDYSVRFFCLPVFCLGRLPCVAINPDVSQQELFASCSA